MNQLLPIIRRKRRPLVVAAAPPVVSGESVATKPVAPGEPEKQPEKTDAPITINRKAR